MAENTGAPETELTEAQKKKLAEKEENQNEKLQAKLYQLEQENRRMAEKIEYLKQEKREPGIKTIDSDGNERKKKPNSFGLSDMVLPPYMRRRVAIYQVKERDEINPATGKRVDPFDIMIPGRFVFQDRFEKDPNKMKKVIRNVVSTEERLVGGKTETVEVVDDILFQRGIKQVVIDESYPLYVLLELHPNNGSNKFRPSNAPIIFERMDINTKSAASQSASINLIRDAMNEIDKMSREDVLAYAAAVGEINVMANRPLHEVKADLNKYAMGNPIGYFKLSKNSKAAVQINIVDAINFGLVEYSLQHKGYIYTETEETISIHTPSQDPMEALVRCLSSKEGEVWYQKIMERMQYWGN